MHLDGLDVDGGGSQDHDWEAALNSPHAAAKSSSETLTCSVAKTKTAHWTPTKVPISC